VTCFVKSETIPVAGERERECVSRSLLAGANQVILMKGMITLIEADRGALCLDILKALPEWFGLPEAIADYARAVEELPMFGFSVNGEIVGFLSLKSHTPVAAEAYVLGVKKPWQRQGAGKRLFEAAETSCRATGVKFLTVKTLAPSHPDPFYARTRAFYEAIGFLPSEIFPTLWSYHDPCLLMVKALA
jgi:GNAT superfamily N-acetyltransferase